ncbi:MAG: hypothetical protein IJZ42_04495 [Lachnospiraceae bacterium]|nr:hypothetical protein [Lachnospiraceae bacterium]
MKKNTLITSALLLCLSLTACGHEHTFTDATCTVPMTCSECGITEGEATGHIFSEATCDTAMTCSMCGITEGEALGHTWMDATCETAKTCSVCGATEGNPLEHSWIEATTEAPKTCELCGLTDGEPLAVEETETEEEITEETETETEVVDEEVPLEEDGCNNTIPEDEVQWYLDTLGLTREQFNKLTNEQIEQMIMDWVSNGSSDGGSSSSGGSSGGGNSSGGSTPSFTEDGGLDEGDSLPPLELGDPSEAPAGSMG